MSDSKFSEEGCWLKLSCKMGRCIKKVENHCCKRSSWLIEVSKFVVLGRRFIRAMRLYV